MLKIYDIYTSEKLPYFEQKNPLYTYERENKLTHSVTEMRYYGLKRARVARKMWVDSERAGWPFSGGMYDEVMEMEKDEVHSFSTLRYDYRITCKR